MPQKETKQGTTHTKEKGVSQKRNKTTNDDMGHALAKPPQHNREFCIFNVFQNKRKHFYSIDDFVYVCSKVE